MDRKNNISYMAIFIALGAGVGSVFDQIPAGICFGVALGVVLDIVKKK